MKIIYLECSMGAAGDMLGAALYELLDDSGKAEFLKRMSTLEKFGVTVCAEKAESCGISGARLAVSINGIEEDEYIMKHAHGHMHEHGPEHPHKHSALHGIKHVISELSLPESVKNNAAEIYGLIADAESRAHGCKVNEVHFHEIGSLDAVADIVSVCMLLEMLGAEKIYVSPVRTGYGQIKCAHGILPVPAPATAYLLEGVPCFAGGIEGEFCTPTGAALLKYFTVDFEQRPPMTILKTGYGMGTRKYEAANCVRAFLGETEENAGDVAELCCNIDDMTSEELAFAAEELLSAGALDVYTTPIVMKKGRAAFMLTCMCVADKREELLRLIFKHTTTLGVREYRCRRWKMSRTEYVCETRFGNVRLKKSEGCGCVREKAEYEDLARLARENNVSLREVQKEIK